jgi:hypothetical protein
VRHKVILVRGAQKSLLAIPSPYFEQIEAKLRVLADKCPTARLQEIERSGRLAHPVWELPNHLRN